MNLNKLQIHNYGGTRFRAQRFSTLEILKCSWMYAWEEWCSIRVEDEFIAFLRLQELHLDVLLKCQDQHRALLGLLKLSNFLKQSFMQFCRLLVLTKLKLLQHST